MKMRKLISILLALITVVGSACLTSYASTVTASAAYEDKLNDEGEPKIDYLAKVYATGADKLKDMIMVREQNGFQLWYEEFTGEVALVDPKTGEGIFSNPYDIAVGNYASKATRQQLLSQLAVTFSYNGVQSTMYSYTDAALLNQITYKNIKNGIRVEYAIGELLTTRLVPRMISKVRFESMIKNNITNEEDLKSLMSFYSLMDPDDVTLTESNVKEMQAAFPVTKKFAVYVCETDVTSKELRNLEQIIKTFCPLYTYEEMEQDHNDCDYVSQDVAPPNFKMAIEYTINENGLEARLPANGIRFDESTYNLISINMLPYMGCGRGTNEGYSLIPDGSGTLIRFEDVENQTYNVSGQMYGADYAYHTISGQHTETMTMPVFGVVETKHIEKGIGTKKEEYDFERGYLAIITEGDSMANLMCENGGRVHVFNNVYASFYPRPSDSYNLADSISVSGASTLTVTSDRKYAGSYRIKYILLGTEFENGEKYDTTYVGMAKAYQDYLEGTGAITQLKAEEVGNNIPLYIETFGAIQTTDRVMSFPVTVDTALTSFEDVKTMYNELAEEGVDNINFRLTGYYNGGLDNTYISKLDWEKVVGGESGFKDLIAYAGEKNFGVYPEFDFAYQRLSDWFDGVSQKRDLVKSIDDRYMSKREYDAAMQSFESDFALAISATVYDYFYEKFDANYSKYNAPAVSVSTLGTDLNSDFNDDDPYNREDSKAATVELLAALDEKYSVMINGGNSYAVPYVDHIIDIATDSSNLLRASETVPFVTMVLHGYVNYTGSAINMEGDVQNTMLKAIETGSSLYFTLCYQNTTALKESDEYNKYYSVSYDIWKEDIVEYYNVINEALSDVQTSKVVDHQFLDGSFNSDSDVAADAGYVVESGSIVMVEYDNGTKFVVNYNSFPVIAEDVDGTEHEVDGLGFVKIEG
ncbi:MAG: hypothetical protein IJ499_05050 [Clostridia bacterium]|nr:hypothetical protein [Clostridia bacterium]